MCLLLCCFSTVSDQTAIVDTQSLIQSKQEVAMAECAGYFYIPSVQLLLDATTEPWGHSLCSSFLTYPELWFSLSNVLTDGTYATSVPPATLPSYGAPSQIQGFGVHL